MALQRLSCKLCKMSQRRCLLFVINCIDLHFQDFCLNNIFHKIKMRVLSSQTFNFPRSYSFNVYVAITPYIRALMDTISTLASFASDRIIEFKKPYNSVYTAKQVSENTDLNYHCRFFSSYSQMAESMAKVLREAWADTMVSHHSYQNYHLVMQTRRECLNEERRTQVTILDDLLCSDTLPSDILTWNNGTIPKLAQSIEDGDEGGWPVFADALEDAGTPLKFIEHARSKQKHYHGCWLIDAALGKW
jgi:hypothetical protein